MKDDNFSGMKVLVMGLGLNGGGTEAALYLARRGALVSVTDIRDEKILAPSIEKLSAFQIRYVLGRHEIEDFRNADMVIKNPVVKPDSPYLKAAKRIETDISLFLAACPARILAVTGSKGKSSVSSALYYVLSGRRGEKSGGKLPGTSRPGKAWLGGNIAISVLSFLDQIEAEDDVVLELSSWQLGDLRGRDLLKPRAAIITPIMKDHQEWYTSMLAYVNDKKLIYKNQDPNDATVAADDEWGRSFLAESRGRPLVYSQKPLDSGVPGGWIEENGGPGLARLWKIPGEANSGADSSARGEEPGRVAEVVPARPLIPGAHQKQNLLAAALALLDLGLDPDFIREKLGTFPGLEHRLEFFHERNGIRFYNDTTATIPEAAAAALHAFDTPQGSEANQGCATRGACVANQGCKANQGCDANLVLVAGGTDKGLDFSPLAKAAVKAREIILLAGTGSDKLKGLLDRDGVKYRGPFDSMDAAINYCLEAARPGDNIILSPGCTSFGMFTNEFDRGNKWKEGVRRLFP